MHRFIDGEDRMQRTLLPNSLEDYVDAENPVRVIDVFIDELDLAVYPRECGHLTKLLIIRVECPLQGAATGAA